MKTKITARNICHGVALLVLIIGLLNLFAISNCDHFVVEIPDETAPEESYQYVITHWATLANGYGSSSERYLAYSQARNIFITECSIYMFGYFAVAFFFLLFGNAISGGRGMRCKLSENRPSSSFRSTPQNR